MIISDDFKRPVNAQAYAIGRASHGLFVVRRIVWGKLLASYERRDGEIIRRAIIMVERSAEAKLKANPGRAKGGYARAAALDPERRTAIARKAAETRWRK
jgi:hypothetical protein